MSDYAGMSEIALKSMLDRCTNFDERRKIRSAIRNVKNEPLGGPTQIGRTGSKPLRQSSSPMESRLGHRHSFDRSSVSYIGTRQSSHLTRNYPSNRKGGSELDKDRKVSSGANVYHDKPRHLEDLPSKAKTTSKADLLGKTSSMRKTSRDESASLTARNSYNSASSSSRRPSRDISQKTYSVKPVKQIDKKEGDSKSACKMTSQDETLTDTMKKRQISSATGSMYDWIQDMHDEAELEKVLRESHDFDERRKIRAQLRKIREESDKSIRNSSQSHNRKKDEEEKNEIRLKKKTVTEAPKKTSRETMEMNYEEIENEEDLMRLLNSTDDYFVKKKIRAALRVLRKKGEIPVQSPARKNSAAPILTNQSNKEKENQSSVNVRDIQNENALEKMLEETRDFDKRREIRAAMRELRAKIREGKVQPPSQKTNSSNESTPKVSPRDQAPPSGVKESRKPKLQDTKAGGPNSKATKTEKISSLKENEAKMRIEQKSTFSPKLDNAAEPKQETCNSDKLQISDNLANEEANLPAEVCDENENAVVLLPDFMDTSTDVKITKSTDGTVTLEQSKNEEGNLRKVSMSFKHQRTESQSDEMEKDTVIVTEKEDPSGDKIIEKEEVVTRKKLTSKGSFLVKRDTKVSTKYRSKSGAEFIDEEILTEEDSKSVSKGTASHVEVHSTVHKEKPSDKQHLKFTQSEVSDENRNEIQKDEMKVKDDINVFDVTEKVKDIEEKNSSVKVSEKHIANGSSKKYEVENQDYPIPEGKASTDSQIKETVSLGKSLQVTEGLRDLSKRSSGYGSDKDASEEDVKDDIFEDKVKEITVEPKPTISLPLSDLSVLDGETATFKCECQNGRDASVSWYKNGNLLKPSKDFQLEFDSHTATLKIDEVFPEDSGEYKCVIITKGGQTETTATLTVKDNPNLVAPIFTKQLSDLTVMDGEKVSLECEVSGTPEPTVVWHKGNKVLKNCSDFKQSFDGSRAILCITEVFPDDTGKFTCLAKNEAGETKSACQLTVKEPTQNEEEENQVPSQPYFTKSLMDIMAEDGQKVELVCSLTGSPEPTISWYKDGLIISKKNPDFTQIFSDNVAKLVISEVLPDDEGQFKCLAKNSMGEAETVATLKLKVPPVEGRCPEVLEPLQDTVATDGKPMTLQCHFYAIPEPSITWYKKGEVLKEDGDFKPSFSNGVAKLNILEVFPEDEGEYSCAAKNSFGEVKCSCRMSVEKGDRSGEGEDSSESANTKNIPEESTAADASMVDGALAESDQNLDEEQDTEMKEKRAAVDRRDINAEAKELSDITMADRDVDEINEEDVLQRMLNQTQDFDLRKKIRNRIKYLREFHKKQRDEEAKARQMASQDEMKRRAQLEDEAKAARLAAMSKRHESAVPDFTKSDAESKEAAKARQMKKFEEEAKTSQLGAKSGADAGTRARIEKADAQKEATMRAYGRIAEDEAFDKTITDVTTTKDASGTKTTTTTTTKTTGGFTKKPAGPPDAQSLAEQFSNCDSPGTSGSITVKYQAWNSRDGLIENTVQTKTWGGGTTNLSKSKYPSTLANLGKSRGAIAALGGAKGARAAFQGMDAKTGGGAPAKPNFVRMNANAIKQQILNFVKANTMEYQNYGVNITNFSSSWNDGMAFCALIHHFYPDAFDFSTLDSKNRRANFTLAFDTAEKLADISPLLDVEDMVRMKTPDWKCVFCYVQMMYRTLRSHEANQDKSEQ